MPKKTIDFPEQLAFMVTYDMRVRLMAYAFLTGSGTSYARVARNMLAQALDVAIKNLDDERRKALEEIMANVKISYPERYPITPPEVKHK